MNHTVKLKISKLKIKIAIKNNWELFKFEISKYLRNFGSNVARIKAAEENAVVNDILTLSKKNGQQILQKMKI